MFLCLKKIIFLCLKIYLFTQKKTRRVVVTRLVMGCGGGLVMTGIIVSGLVMTISP